MDEAIRIRMEGGLETIEAASAQCRQMASRLRRSTSSLGMMFLDRGALADDVQRFARGQERVDEAVARLRKILVEGSEPPKCLEELDHARRHFADAIRKACWAVHLDATGELHADCQRLKEALRSPAVEAEFAASGPPSPTAWMDYARLRSQGALLNLAGPLAIVGFATASSGMAGPAFVGWLVLNALWLRSVSRWPCPRCRRPFSGHHLLSPTKCEHCGLARNALPAPDA